jgi:hypothetical protein
VEYRDYLARSPMYTGAEAHDELALDAPEYLDAAAGLAEDAHEWLKGLVREWGQMRRSPAVWTDSYGGLIEVVEREGRFIS